MAWITSGELVKRWKKNKQNNEMRTQFYWLISWALNALFLKHSSKKWKNSNKTDEQKKEKQMELLNNFNGLSLAVIMVLSYFAVLKSTKRDSYQQKQVALNRHYQ